MGGSKLKMVIYMKLFLILLECIYIKENFFLFSIRFIKNMVNNYLIIIVNKIYSIILKCLFLVNLMFFVML